MTTLLDKLEQHRSKVAFMIGFIIGSIPSYIILWKLKEIC